MFRFSQPIRQVMNVAAQLLSFVTLSLVLGASTTLAMEGYAVSKSNWENGFDAKLTSIAPDESPDPTSPNLMFSAQWNYKLVSNTFIGGSLSSLAQPHTERADGVATSYMMYYGGLNLAQGLLDIKPFRLVLTASAGKGVFYARTDADVEKPLISADFTYVEPGVFATFYQWDSLEFGAMVSSRMVKLDKDDAGTDDEDLSSLSYGLTFRAQRR